MATDATTRRVADVDGDDSVVIAARRVFAVHGPDAPVSAVAAEAGTGIGSLYRRFPSKQALLQYLCTESMRQIEALAATALEEDDAWVAFTGFVHECVAQRAGAFGATLAGTVEITDDMRRLAKHGHQLLERLLARAQADGAVRPDVTAIDVRLLIELFSRRPLGEHDIHDRLLGLALDGLSASGERTPPALPPLDWAGYLARWRLRPR